MPDGPEVDLGHLVRRGLKSALARWVLRRRDRDGREQGWRPQSRDEGTHPWDGRRYFAEDYTFAAVQKDLAITVRLEWLPGRGAHRVWVVLLTPHGAFSLPRGRGSLVQGERDHWKVGGVELDCVEPHRHWTLRFSGELMAVDQDHESSTVKTRCNIDLEFASVLPVYVPGSDDDPDLIAGHLGSAVWDARLLRAVRRAAGRGYVQLGEMRGTVVLGSELLAVMGKSIREHWWGVRDWGGSDHAFQVLAVPDVGPVAWLHHARFPWLTLEGGFVARPTGMLRPVRAIGFTRERDAHGHAMRLTIDVVHGSEDNIRLSALVLAKVPFEVDGRGRVQLALVRLSGPSPGWAIWAEQQRALPRQRHD